MKKLHSHSDVFNRAFHVDYWASPSPPRFLTVMFGGSGHDRGDYEKRAHTTPPRIASELTRLKDEFAFAFCFVTAPYDVPFPELEEEEEASNKWQTHVNDEILPLLPTLPVFWMAYSGGAALVLNGVHENERSFGAGFLGADQVAAGFSTPTHWRAPARFVYNREDRVLVKSSVRLQALAADGNAEIIVGKPPAGHAFTDYLGAGLFAGLLRYANRLVG